jgi:hypothetical protein
MLDRHIEDNELLYRRIILNPNSWKVDRPSSAAFKDSLGCSVDRDGGRQVAEIISLYNSKFELKAIVRVTAGYCRQIEAHPDYIPYPSNPDEPYHSEIHDSPVRVQISDSKAKKLARNSEIVWQK